MKNVRNLEKSENADIDATVLKAMDRNGRKSTALNMWKVMLEHFFL